MKDLKLLGLVGASRNSKGGTAFLTHYANGDKAIIVNGPSGEREYVATVSMPQPPNKACVWIKDWSENTGVFAALEEAGIIRDTGRRQQAGFAVAKEAMIVLPLSKKES
jgi:hypothetical protein